jgi:hypothetical protein
VSLADAIARFATPHTIIRRGGVFAAGRWQPGEAEELEVNAAVQPASPQELARLPEGQRSREVLAVYTPTELRIGGPGAAADRLEHAGATYEVQSVERWDAGGFYKALAAKVV